MKKERGHVVTTKILDTAERLFYSQGYNTTGINQIIEESDIAKASLYKHFESKTDLLVAYLQRFYESSFARLEDTVEKTSDPAQKLLAIFDHYSERQLFRKYGGCPFVKANDEAGLSDARVLAEIQRAKERLKDFIYKQVAVSGHSKKMTDQELGQMIYLMVEGGMVAASVFKNSNDLQSAKSIILKLI